MRNIDEIDLMNLELDLENPRLPLSFSKDQRDTKGIVNWLLEDASIIELMTAIGQNDFFVGEALLVTKSQYGNKYTVVEGNRRLASLMLLSNPELAEIHKRRIGEVLNETTYRPDKIPCIIFETREEILNYLGYRHVTGVKSWSLVAKARYLNSLKKKYSDQPISIQSKSLAKHIGSRSDYVKKLLVSYMMYEIVEDEGFYRIPDLNDTTFYFNYISDSLTKKYIRTFLNVDLTSENPLEGISTKNLKELIHWFFEKNDKGKSLVKGDSNDLTKLNRVLSNAEALVHFRDTGDLAASELYVSHSPESYSEEIQKSFRIMKFANSLIYKVECHNETDIDVLKDINELCKTMRDVIKGKEEAKDDWD